MAKIECSSIHPLYSNHQLRQAALFSLISELCTPRQQLHKTELRQLIVDSRLPWSFEPIDNDCSWLYLDRLCRVEYLAGCLVLSAD